MFDELCKTLDHSLSQLPYGHTFLIRDCAEIDGCFLLYHFVSLFYRATRRVVLVCIQNTPKHYSVALARFGVQMERAVENGNINLVDFTSTLSKWNGQQPDKLVEGLTENVVKATSAFSIFSDAGLLALDCLYTLEHLNSPPSSLCTFILTCAHAVAPNGCLVMKTRAACNTSLESMCLRLADDVLDVAPLETGSGNDLNCQLNVRRRRKDKLVFEKRKLLARLHERNVRFFNPGLVPGVAI